MKKKKKSNNKKRKLSLKKIFLLIFAIITIIFITFLKISNFIPTLYFLIILLLAIGIYAIVFLLLKKKMKLGYIISGIFITIYLVATYFLGITMNFFNSFSKIHYNEETYLVLVLKNNYKKIEDLESKNIGYIKNELNSIDNAIDKLNKKINVGKKIYDESNTLFEDLDNQKIESILIDETYYNIRKEEEKTDNYEVIYEIKIKNIVKNTNKYVDITKKPFTVYISGIDVYGNIETVSRSDVNILMTINPETKQILLTSIPRDYYVQLANTTGYKDKLTHAGNYGINMSIETIENLLNININYYLRVNFTTLEKLIDSIGGIDVYSEYSFVSYIDNYKFYKGYNHMNGKQALAFSRERKSLPGGDNDRGKNQEAVIEAIIRKATSKNVIYKYSKILSNIKGTFQTNISDTDITKLIKKELSNLGGWNITSISLTGTGDYNYTYSYSSQKLYVTIPNKESITTGTEMINKVIEGKLLESSYKDNPEDIKYPNKVQTDSSPTKENNNQKDEKEDIQDNITNDNIENNNSNNNNNSTTTNNNNNPLEDLLPSGDKEETNEDNQNNNYNNNENTNDNSNNNNEDTDTTENDNYELLLPEEANE